VKNGPGGQRDLVTALDALLASLLHQLIGSAMPANAKSCPPAVTAK
jgi:hypothetical protein